jgi:hypothetical protein
VVPTTFRSGDGHLSDESRRSGTSRTDVEARALERELSAGHTEGSEGTIRLMMSSPAGPRIEPP